MKDKYFIVQYFYWSDRYRMNHSFETFQYSYYELSEIKVEAEETIKNNNSIDGYYITEQEILLSNT